MNDKAAHQHTEGHTHAILRWSDDSVHDIDETTRYPLMTEAIRQILVEKGLISADAVRRLMEQMDARSDVTGGKIVARAWVDPAFKARLLANAKKAIAELGIPEVDATHLIVVENTETVHNVVVCTLCSCYPRIVLGMPPEWYKSKAYRSRVVREPRAVLKEFGTDLADTVTVRVHDSNADMRYLVLPMRPPRHRGVVGRRPRPSRHPRLHGGRHRTPGSGTGTRSRVGAGVVNVWSPVWWTRP
jgi:nitrile hydratase subunit alpha